MLLYSLGIFKVCYCLGLSISVGNSHPTLSTSATHQSYLNPEVTLTGPRFSQKSILRFLVSPVIIISIFPSTPDCKQGALAAAHFKGSCRYQLEPAWRDFHDYTEGSHKGRNSIQHSSLVSQRITLLHTNASSSSKRCPLGGYRVPPNGFSQPPSQWSIGLTCEKFCPFWVSSIWLPLISGHPPHRTVTANSEPRKIKLVLLEFKKTVGLFTNPNTLIQWSKINQKHYGKYARGIQSIISNPLTVSSKQQSRMKSHRIGHKGSQRKPI